jgi:L-amino acid N-acyltransferase YncA
MSTRIRAATAADIPAITAIYAHAVRFGTASFEIDPPDVAEMGERFAVLAAGGFPYLVAATDTGIAGYAYAGPYRTRVAYRNTVEDSVYLGPQFHRRGIGRALLDRLVTESEARGYRQMVAVIGDSSQVGFRMVGTLEAVGHKFGRWIGTVLMQRALGEGAATQPSLSVRHHAK